jgi:putative photosynthetic complex assembly protein 2
VTFILPILYAALLWWFTTGLIFAVSRRSRRTVRISFALGSFIAIGAIYMLLTTAREVSPGHIYLAFTSGLLIWGWLVAGYYFGFVTGPQTTSLNAVQPHPMGKRFRLALRGSLYHELLIAGVAVLLFGLTWSQPNRWGLWIFLALWLMHSSAKLCVFLGVRNFRVDFLPPHLHYVRALLGRRPGNPLLPITVCLAISVSLALLYQVVAPGADASHITGSLLVATMLLLGVMEHLLLVLPLPFVLFGWGVRPLPSSTSEQEIHAAQTQNAVELPSMKVRVLQRKLVLPPFLERHWESYRP